MEETVSRPRYQRHTLPARRKRRTDKATYNVWEGIFRQAVIAAAVFLLIAGIKAINTSPTNFISDKIKAGLSQNIDMKGMYDKFDTYFKKLYSKEGSDSLDSSENETADSSSIDSSADNNSVSTGDASIDSSVIMALKEKYNFVVPVKGNITSPFGKRLNPKTKEEENHKGIDIDAGKGAPIAAALDGKVIEASSNPTYGKYIKLECGDGIVLLFAHCSQLVAEKDQTVKQGDVIAKVGDTGLAIGAHLHFEVIINGTPVDPSSFIQELG